MHVVDHSLGQEENTRLKPSICASTPSSRQLKNLLISRIRIVDTALAQTDETSARCGTSEANCCFFRALPFFVGRVRRQSWIECLSHMQNLFRMWPASAYRCLHASVAWLVAWWWWWCCSKWIIIIISCEKRKCRLLHSHYKLRFACTRKHAHTPVQRWSAKAKTMPFACRCWRASVSFSIRNGRVSKCQPAAHSAKRPFAR